ncbi:MAG: GDP-L-fucose synthase [Ignavibacteria bacterium]|nr:GDP-L-fucose synthase [Ignavibacteria bacterium]
MKALITGATGFVGSHLADKLLEKNYDVYCLKRKSSNTRWLKDKNVKYVEGDLFSNEALSECISKMDYVFHVAGLVKARTKDEYMKANFESTKNLLEITHRVNPGLKKFILISSLAGTGPAVDEDYVNENSVPHPITSYGFSKMKAEQEVMSYSDRLRTCIIAPPAVFGPRDTEILIYFQTYCKGLNSIIGFDEKYLSLIYVEDLVKGIVLAAEKEESVSQKFFVSMDKAYNWDEIGTVTKNLLQRKAFKIRLPHSLVFSVGYISEFAMGLFGKAATLNVEKCKDITQLRWTCSNNKIKSMLGFEADYSLESGFRKTIDWYKEMKWIK